MEERCPKNRETHLHYPDISSVTRDSDAPDLVLDVACVHCGRSGSFTLDPTEVSW